MQASQQNVDLHNNIYKHNTITTNNNNSNNKNNTPIFMPSLLSPHTTTLPLTNQHPYTGHTGHTTGEVDGRDPLLVTSKGHMTSKKSVVLLYVC